MTETEQAAAMPEGEFSDPFERLIEGERRKKNRLHLCVCIAVTAAVVLVLFQFLTGIAFIRGDSMEPNLTDGCAVLFTRREKTYRRGDIVIFRPPGASEVLVKRVAAVAGDRVDIDDKTGTFTVNGASREDVIVNGRTYKRNGGTVFPFTVPGGCIFVLGDNREVALDSRVFGAVGVDRVVGKAVFTAAALKSGG